MKIGILKEGKVPADARVALTPPQVAFLRHEKQMDIVVQRSDIRCYSDEEYSQLGLPLVDSVQDCDVLIGVKEVPIDALISGKTYFFFSHTIKKQSYNQTLLSAILEKNIRLIDYEVLTDDAGQRLIAFGFFAGMVGAYNGILGYGLQSGTFALQRLENFVDYAEASQQFEQLNLPPIKIVLTGTGRVGMGAAKVLKDMGVQQVDHESFLEVPEVSFPIFTQLAPKDYVERRDGGIFELASFYSNPESYKATFEPYTQNADLMINGIYWDNRAPAFFSMEQMQSKDFNIKLIADITCDIAPVSSIPSTLRASTIEAPFFGYDPASNKEIAPFVGGIDMMTIDNLPSELPRDASNAFGQQFIDNILPCLENGYDHPVIQRATITKNGKLGSFFQYLEDYAFAN